MEFISIYVNIIKLKISKFHYLIHDHQNHSLNIQIS